MKNLYLFKMQATDSLTSHYLPLLEGTYDCLDGIVLNAYIPNLLHAGGVRNWYRMMKGGDEDLSTSAFMKLRGDSAGGYHHYASKEIFHCFILKRETAKEKRQKK